MKVCSKCKEEKELSLFSKDKKGKNGLFSFCKGCEKEYRENNKEKIKEYKKEYRENNEQKIKEEQKEYRENNKEKLKKYSKEYYKNNKLKRKEYDKKYREDNKEKRKAIAKEYYIKNKEKINEYKKEYDRNRKQTDILYKLSCNIRVRIYQSIKNQGYTKRSQAYKILGCTYEEFKEYLENQFTKGMSWENQGKWHLDHIIPISSAKTEEDVIRLNHYTNFQPLWAEDNFKKGKKYEEK
jgi:hypothetical protein